MVFGDNSSAPGVKILVEKIKLNYKYERCDDAKIAGYHSISCKIALVKTGIQLRPSTTDPSALKPYIGLFFSLYIFILYSKVNQKTQKLNLEKQANITSKATWICCGGSELNAYQNFVFYLKQKWQLSP